MPQQKYEVTAPDGRVLEVTGPAGASQDEVIEQAMRLYKPIGGVKGISIKGPVTEYTIEATGKPLSLPTAMPESRVRQLIDGHVRAVQRGPQAESRPQSILPDLESKKLEVMMGGIKELGNQGMRVLNKMGVKPGTSLALPGLPSGMSREGYRQPAMTMTTTTESVPIQPGAEAAGSGLVKIGEYMLPGALVKSLAPAQVAALTTAGKAGLEAAGTYGVSRLQGQTPKEAATAGATAGAFTGGVGKLLEWMPSVGRRIESVVLKPSTVDLQAESVPISEASDKLTRDVFKYKLGGTLAETYDKSTTLLKTLGQNLRTILKANPKATVNLDDVWLETLDALTDTAGGKFSYASEPAKSAALNKLADGISALGNKVDLADANEVKQALGLLGSWSSGVRDREAAAMEEVAAVMYTKLRLAIEKSAGRSAGPIKAINQQMSDVIPIRNAVIRRIPVADRREVISLKEAIALVRGNVPGFGLAIADRGLRSGTVANVLANTTTAKAGPAGRLAGALVGQIQDEQ